jgi:4,5-DOPA dioxygenase extradiol
MYPAADVPVLSVSLPTHDAKTLWRMGRALRPLRDEGVLVLASGSLTHNLRKRARDANAEVVSWAGDFDRWATDVLTRGAVAELLDWQRRAPAARTNHPTGEHFVPLLIAEGARHDADRATFPVTGFEYGSLSRRSVMLG